MESYNSHYAIVALFLVNYNSINLNIYDQENIHSISSSPHN